MSPTIRKLIGAFTRKHFKMLFSNLRRSKPSFYVCVIGGATVLTAGYFATGNYYLLPSVSAKKGKQGSEIKLNSAEKRFIKFASSQYDGQLYMSPRDFLESVIYTEPRPRIQRKHLTDIEMHLMRDDTPTLEQGSSRLFRDIHHRGIISYVEYLFLLSILYKPHTQFKIAFNAFDRDGNGVVDKNEFCIIERIFSDTLKGRKNKSEDGEDIYDDEALHREHDVETTLQLHFFGQDGQSVLSFESFSKFMRDLQTELLEIEFFEFARSLEVISEVEFMRIILRYSFIDIDEFGEYVDDVLERIHDPIGITFQEFKDFGDFLNYLDDFSYAVNLYMPANEGIGKYDFRRAVKVTTGIDLSKHLVDTIFAIFGTNDEKLDFKDFLDIVKDRQKRVFQTHTKSEGWQGFKACIRNEVNSKELINYCDNKKTYIKTIIQ